MFTHPLKSAGSGTRVALRAALAATVTTVAFSGFAVEAASAHELPEAADPSVATAATPADADTAAPAESVTHTVERGDSLSDIAERYGYNGEDDWRRIFDANPAVENPNVIHPGQELRIPAADEELEPRALPVPPPAPVVAERGRSAAASAPSAPSGASASRTAAPSGGGASVAGAGVWDQLAACESGGNWSINTGNGYAGGLQFHPRTWTGFGGGAYAPSADQATKQQQIDIAQRVQASQGWGAWPACSRKLGLR